MSFAFKIPYKEFFKKKKSHDSFKKDKVQLQNWLQPKTITFFKKINITTYFENLTVKLHVLYAKFYANKILFAI